MKYVALAILSILLLTGCTGRNKPVCNNGPLDLQITATKPGTGFSMEPAAALPVARFHAKRNAVILRREVSNYHSIRGIWVPVHFGSPAAMTAMQTKEFLIAAFIVGALLIMGCYHLGLFTFRPTEKSPLYLAIICFCFAMQQCISRYSPFFFLLPDLPYHLSLKILYTLFPVILISFIYFMQTSGIFRFGKLPLKIVAGVCAAYIALLCLKPDYVYANHLLLLLGATFIFAGFTVKGMIREIIALKAKQLLMSAGIIICLLCLLNDALFDAGYIETGFLLPFGFFLFILCQSFILAIQFARNYKQTELLAKQLAASSKAYEQMALKRREIEEAEAISALKNRFLVNITHEFRTPLSLILAPAEHLLQQSAITRDQQNEVLTIYKNARHLMRLMHQLLDLSKLDAGKMEKTEQLVNLREFVEDIVTTFNVLANQKCIKLHFESSASEQYCFFDVDKLEKIIYNLLSNAIKFTGNGGNIYVRLSYHQDTLWLEVADTGIGIPGHALEQIFQPYYQVPDNNFKTTEGSGIGLQLVKEFVTLLNGQLDVKSTPGKGSCFTVVLPLTFLETGNFLPENTATSHKPTLLIIENNVFLRQYLHNVLQPQYDVKTANNGNDGWELVRSELPDIVLCNLTLPGKDGYDIANLIRRTPKTNHIGLIILSGQATTSSKMKGLNLGANDYITKPFHLPELIMRIGNQVKYQQTLRQYHYQHLTTPNTTEEEVTHPFLQQLYTILDEHLDDSTFSVPDLANKMAMSTRTLNRKLSTINKMSSNELIRHYRLKKAASFLSSGASISEAAYMTGFESPSYFGQCFKDVYQLTPSEYIRNARPGKGLSEF
jgi:signal transduction histidine kinase/DNA-binding response OmpR family regulator